MLCHVISDLFTICRAHIISIFLAVFASDSYRHGTQWLGWSGKKIHTVCSQDINETTSILQIPTEKSAKSLTRFGGVMEGASALRLAGRWIST